MAKTITVAGRSIEVRENLLDRVIGYLDPVRARQRLGARVFMAAAGGYSGGRRDKRGLSAWKPLGNSADSDLLPDLPTLRERSRDLVRNAPIAAGAINTAVTNIVGTGLMLKSRVHRDVLGWEEDQAAEWQKAVEREFRSWAETSACDITRQDNLYGLQRLALRSKFENGDVIGLLPFVANRRSRYELAVQLIEADRLCNPHGRMDSPTFSGGVELDANGAAIAYHIMTQHPGDRTTISKEWKRYDAYGSRSQRRNVLHVFTRKRVGQTRGVPWFATVIEAFKGIDRYTEAEVFAAVANAMFAVKVKSPDKAGLSPLDSAISGATPTSGTTDSRDAAWDGTLTPGLVVDLGMDEDISSVNPGRPNANFDPFVQAVLRQVGVALELPFEVLIKHFTSSYTAARASLLEAWKFYKLSRHELADSFCQPIFEAWMEEAIARGVIRAPGFFDNPLLRAAYLGSEWLGDGPGSVDPVKEATAAKLRVEIPISTVDEEIAAYSGRDFDTVVEQRSREKKALDVAGLTVQPAQPAAPAGEPSNPGDTDDDPPRRQ